MDLSNTPIDQALLHHLYQKSWFLSTDMLSSAHRWQLFQNKLSLRRSSNKDPKDRGILLRANQEAICWMKILLRRECIPAQFQTKVRSLLLSPWFSLRNIWNLYSLEWLCFWIYRQRRLHKVQECCRLSWKDLDRMQLALLQLLNFQSQPS